MDSLRIAVRVAFTFAIVLVLIRASGKRTINHGDLSSFTVAAVIGDLFDDFFWAEVAAAQFIVAVGTIAMLHLMTRTSVTRSGMRNWLRERTSRDGGTAGAPLR
jgi:uncharacterized membrane protein YcaP (DUF421 family)